MERIHTKFCKFALNGIRTKSSNLASRGELGRYPLLPYILLNMIKFWCRLKEHSTDNNILANAFELSNAMHLENKISWVRNIREIFDYLEMSYLFNNSARYTSDTIIRKVKKSLLIKFETLWFNELNIDVRKDPQAGYKLRTYCMFKTIFQCEPYLKYGNEKERRLLTKFRVSSHNLNIEKGRYIGVKVNDQVCELCKESVEDEMHFLIKCPHLETHRKLYINMLINKYKNFAALSEEHKFIWMMCSEDKAVINVVLKLISCLFEERLIKTFK